jgi:protein phosphatase
MEISIKKPSSLTEKGRREINEDSIFPKEGQGSIKDRLFVICDGLGGQKYGEIASNLACEALVDYLHFENEFIPERAIHFVEMRFSDYIDLSPEYDGMATTIVFLYLRKNDAIIGWVGDSRAYHIRNGQILFQTDDHSLVNELIKQGKLTPEKARVDVRRNIVTRVIGNFKVPLVPDYKIINDIQSGDFFFLCSDGILENIDEDFIKTHFLKENNTSGIKSEIKKICHNNTQDNYSMHIIQIE